MEMESFLVALGHDFGGFGSVFMRFGGLLVVVVGCFQAAIRWCELFVVAGGFLGGRRLRE
ncbi:hypothetical protein KY284_027153 [Solanum tuberosum]|nr:hypothetical protein KY284_027153 [Solanum tuberosum]